MKIREYKEGDFNDWLQLRIELWPHCSREQHIKEMFKILEDDSPVFFLDEGIIAGCIEVSIRHNERGYDSESIAFIEGLYIKPEYQRKGWASALIDHAENWAKKQGFTEIGSDTYPDNVKSRNLHKKLGYEELYEEKTVFFRKYLK